MMITKYFCNLCKKEIFNNDMVYARLHNCIPIGRITQLPIHFHKDCFIKFVGEEEFNKIMEEREEKIKKLFN